VALSLTPGRDSGGAVSEKLKPNFTGVPNVFFDEIMRTLPGGSVKVFLSICRYTYGWQKKSDRISAKQLSDMTGMDRSNVRRAIRQLGPLVIRTPGDSSTRTASEYQINIDVSDSDLVSLGHQTLVSLRHQTGVRPSVTSAPFQRNPKKKNKSAIALLGSPGGSQSLFSVDTSDPKNGNRPAGRARQLEAFARFYEAYPKHVGRDAAEKVWLERSPDESTTKKIMAAIENQKRWRAGHADDPKVFIPEWKDPERWLKKGCWKDELGNNDQPRKERKFINGNG
jgi:phage replication O-like protein O